MLLFALILFLRHLFYDKGWIKSTRTDVRSICVGNLSLGGTGKTPFTELILRTLLEDRPDAEKVLKKEDFEYDGLFAGIGLFDGNFGGNGGRGAVRSIAVLSRGYKRRSKGFQLVTADGTASMFGDEPLQIKRKFPSVTVAVDADRVEGADILAHPSHIRNLSPKIRGEVIAPKFPAADIIILDDAYQHRRIIPTKSILLTTWDRPFGKDVLFPFGRLRDLRPRAAAADMIVVTKCPTMVDDFQKSIMAKSLGIRNFKLQTHSGVNSAGKEQLVLFATVLYDSLESVFPEGDMRYTHSKMAIVVSGIADDKPLLQNLCEQYQLVDHFHYPDHHYFTDGDIMDITRSAMHYVTSVIVTTEKDAQRLRGMRNVPEDIKKRCFYAPIRTMMLSAAEQGILKNFLNE